MRTVFSFFALLISFTLACDSFAQTTPPPPPFFSSANWVRDATTFKIPGGETRSSFSGVRILFEPQLGHLVQEQGNRVVVENISSLSKFGLETNLFENWVSFQFLFISPSKVQLDEESPLREAATMPGNMLPATKDSEGKLNVDYGIGIGLSFIDGMVSIGYSGIFYDKRGFVNITKDEGQYQNNFISINIQPVSIVKALVKELKD